MNLFELPPPTRYDLNFTLFGIPVRVHPLFWVMALLFGGFAGGVLGMLSWVAAVFVSVLVHELGHAFLFRRFGIGSSVALHLAGGHTVPQPIPWGGRWAYIPLSPAQEALVSFAGPAAGFLLAGAVIAGVFAAGGNIIVGTLAGVVPLPIAFLPFGGNFLRNFVMDLLWVNLLWGAINLMPVFPLDGGNIVRRLMIKADPIDGARRSLWISTVAGAVLALVGFFLFRSIYMGLLFGYLAFLSYQTLRSGAGGEV
ncbi:MAG: site-2 protease family protein [Anaerolineales bacterium]